MKEVDAEEFDPRRVLMIVDQIKPLLAGRSPAVQGAVLAELLAIWLAGHCPAEIREPLLEMHLETVWKLVSAAEKERLQ